MCEENFGFEAGREVHGFLVLFQNFSSLSEMYIPDDKRFYRIGEVSRIIGIKPYVLRFWEKEFPGIRPKRADSRHRVYKREDIEAIGELKRLLYEERLTIEGARHRLKALKKAGYMPSPSLMEEIKEQLNQILHILQ